MNNVTGIAWFRDESVYLRALEIFTDSGNMPATYEDWQALVRRQCEEIKRIGDIAIRADIDPDTFVEWCRSRGFLPDSKGRIAYVDHIELEYQKTGKGTVIE